MAKEEVWFLPESDDHLLQGPIVHPAVFQLHLAALMLKGVCWEARAYQTWWFPCFSRVENPSPTKYTTRFSENRSRTSDVALILDFLQSGLDKGLKTSTLKVHISAISAFMDLKLSELLWIKRFILASKRIQPHLWSSVTPWDLNLVLSVRSGHPFEPLEECSLRLLTLKNTFFF